MDDFANLTNPLRVDIDGGGEYLAFAKKKLREMKHLMAMRGIEADNRLIDANGAEVFVKSIPGMDFIRIRGKSAKIQLLLIYVRDTSKETDGYEYELVYDTSGDNNGKDYRALLYRIDDGSSELVQDGLMGEGLSISDTGLTLSVQSGDGTYAAELPSIFVYNETIDYAEFKQTAWRTTLQVLYQNRNVGSHYISGWSKIQEGERYKYAEDTTGLMRMPGSRHAYVSGDDGYITACMFKNQQTLIGAYPMYRELSVVLEDPFYQLWRNMIAYKTAPDDSSHITGTLVGDDYITGIPHTTGYSWMTHNVIDIFDKDNALVKIESNYMAKGVNEALPFTLNLVVTNRWYTDPGGQWYWTTDTWIYNGTTYVEERICQRVERLMVGKTEIEKAEYEESVYNGNRFDWIPGGWPGMSLVSSSGSAHGGYYDGVESASGNVSGPGKFNAPLIVYRIPNRHDGRRSDAAWYPITIGEKHKTEKGGYRDIHVTAFDNWDGANCFIIMYRKSQVYYMDLNETPNSNDGTTPVPIVEQQSNPTVVTHHIAYKTKDGILARTDTGGDIRAASCQIHGGYMAYTYCTFESGKFKHRTIGTIELETGAKTQWSVDDNDDRLTDFQHIHHAAIGIL